jgi:hypothetical protein
MIPILNGTEVLWFLSNGAGRYQKSHLGRREYDTYFLRRRLYHYRVALSIIRALISNIKVSLLIADRQILFRIGDRR